jgi:hypothetical protein
MAARNRKTELAALETPYPSPAAMPYLQGQGKTSRSKVSMSSIKRDVKKKAPTRPEEILSRDPAHSVSWSLKRFGVLFYSHEVSMVLVAKVSVQDAAKQDDVNHGSIRGSWPIAISGYPRGHSV